MTDNTIITVLGMKGAGKTTLVRELLAEYPRVVVVDTLAEYGDDSWSGVFYDLQSAVHALMQYERAPRFRISYRPETDEAALAFLEVAQHLSDFLLVLDEANIYMTPQEIPAILAHYVRRGRHNRISQVYAAQRAASLHREVTAQSDVIIAFRQQEPRDLLYLRSRFGERADWLPHLPPFQCLVAGIEEKVPIAAEIRRVKESPLTGRSESA